MAKDTSEEYWAHQNKLWAQDRYSGGGGHMSQTGFVKKAVKKDALLYVDHNSALGRAIIEDRKQKEQQMAFEYKDGQGSLFVNDKGENPARPDRTGKAMIGGKMYRISGWIKESTNGGKPWLSLSIQEEQQQAAAPVPEAPKSTPAEEDPPF